MTFIFATYRAVYYVNTITLLSFAWWDSSRQAATQAVSSHYPSKHDRDKF